MPLDRVIRRRRTESGPRWNRYIECFLFDRRPLRPGLPREDYSGRELRMARSVQLPGAWGQKRWGRVFNTEMAGRRQDGGDRREKRKECKDRAKY